MKQAAQLFSPSGSGINKKTLDQTVPSAPTLMVTAQSWLCIYPNLLAVDAVASNAMEPTLVSEESSGRIFVKTCNSAAGKYGITADMSLAVALSLCHELAVLPRNLMAEQQMLNQLANRALSLSSQVSIYAEESIVIEIRGSLHLFGSLDALQRQAIKAIDALGLNYQTSIAPTAKAAFWLAKWGNGKQVENMEKLPATLRQLPINVLVRDERRLLRFQRSGITTLADFMRLPRDSVARRFGHSILEKLDQALGRQPEPLEWFQSPYRFSKTQELYRPISDFNLIKPIAAALLKEFEKYLQQRQVVTQQIQCRLIHRDGSETVVNVECSQGCWRADHFFPLLEEHLERLHLPGDVAAVSLFADQMQVGQAAQLDLFDTTVGDEQNWRQFLEQITARLGVDAIKWPLVCADYRPEQAIANSLPRLQKNIRADYLCPLWLLTIPKFLSQSRPGLLHITSEIERIEQGWWDGEDVRRDYRIARGPAGNRLWIYFDQCRKCWFLQGYFG